MTCTSIPWIHLASYFLKRYYTNKQVFSEASKINILKPSLVKEIGIAFKIYINASTIIVTNAAQLSRYIELLVTPFCSNEALKKFACINFESNLWFITTSHLINMKTLEKKEFKGLFANQKKPLF